MHSVTTQNWLWATEKCLFVIIFVNLSVRQLAQMWIRKLSGCNTSLKELRLRNDFMYYLVLYLRNGDLKPPFNLPPSMNKLEELVHNLVSSWKCQIHSLHIYRHHQPNNSKRVLASRITYIYCKNLLYRCCVRE